MHVRAGFVLKAGWGASLKKLKGARLRLLAADPAAHFDRPITLQLQAVLRPSWQRCSMHMGCFFPL